MFRHTSVFNWKDAKQKMLSFSFITYRLTTQWPLYRSLFLFRSLFLSHSIRHRNTHKHAQTYSQNSLSPSSFLSSFSPLSRFHSQKLIYRGFAIDRVPRKKEIYPSFVVIFAKHKPNSRWRKEINMCLGKRTKVLESSARGSRSSLTVLGMIYKAPGINLGGENNEEEKDDLHHF